MQTAGKQAGFRQAGGGIRQALESDDKQTASLRTETNAEFEAGVDEGTDLVTFN